MILVSACLVGINCKYNGGNNFNPKILELVKAGEAIFVCPEQLGGLTTPRLPAEIRYINNKLHVIDKNGNDVTTEYFRGANGVLKLAKELDIKKAILKSKSPACGYKNIYDGNFTNTLINNNGILAQILIDNDIEVVSSDSI